MTRPDPPGGRGVVLTGAARGLGRGTAPEFGRRGALGPDGRPRGSRRRRLGPALQPEEVARASADATAKRRRTLLVSPVARLSLWLWRPAPPVYERLMVANQGAEFSGRRR